MSKRIYILLLLLILVIFTVNAQYFVKIPSVYSNIYNGSDGNLVLNIGGESFALIDIPSELTLENLKGNPQTAPTGILFDFKGALKSGTLYYGLINYEDTKYPLPVYFRSPVRILDGKAFVNLLTLKGRYDMTGWVQKQKGIIGYRVVNETGEFLYDGRIGFKGEATLFIDTTIVEGPFISLLTYESVTIFFDTNIAVKAEIEVGGKKFGDTEVSLHHEIMIDGLESNTEYLYTVHIGSNQETYSFKTAPLPGSRTKFTFGYASDSRSGQGGGERDFNGVNAYIMKKIMALGAYEQCAFMQFTGDLITGYKIDPNQIRLEYANWKRAVEPWARYLPVISAMGNHESTMYYWSLPGGDFYSVDKFPFDKVSTEAIFAENFVNPLNGPVSEDGASYDPNKRNIDFPSYKENVFFYTYDNVAMVVLNSNYWYAPSTSHVKETSGNIHAYIMDNQFKWMEETIHMLENDEDIDHVFVTVHTPFFPNGGHVNDDMWYGGINDYRAYVNGKPVEKGIIERRDELLEVIINKSEKVVALLTGDEHNYCKTHITPETDIYPSDWDKPKLKLNRSIYQVNNGAAGAPYYSQEITPWTPFTTGFTTQNALVLFHVNGKRVQLEVLNPDTLDKVDELELR
jgi:hypothetical protein